MSDSQTDARVNGDNWKEGIFVRIRQLEIIIVLVIGVSLAVHFNSPYVKKSDLIEIKDAIQSIREIQEISTSTISSMNRMILDMRIEAEEKMTSTPRLLIEQPSSFRNNELLRHQRANVDYKEDEIKSVKTERKIKKKMNEELPDTSNVAENNESIKSKATKRNLIQNVKNIAYQNSSNQSSRDELSSSRNLQLNRCNGVVFRIELFLDEWASQTSWTLLNEDTNTVEAAMQYTDADRDSIALQEICAKPGNYKVSIFDDEWGILCSQDNYDCYNMYIDGEMIIQGSWFSGEVHHSFSLDSGCFMKRRFRLELQLDHDSDQTSWTLENSSENFIVASKQYTQDDYNNRDIIEMCLDPGHYLFTLYDDVYGMRCNSEDCLSIYLDNEKIFGSHWFSSMTQFKFDTSSRCAIGSEFLLAIENPYNSFEISWTLQDRKYNILYELGPTENDKIDNDKTEYYVCLEAGSYDFAIASEEAIFSKCENEDKCPRIIINGVRKFIGHKFSIEPTIAFYLSREGNVESLRHHNCDIFPLLSPINEFNNFEYDDRMSRTLEILGSLTSKELMSKHSSPQYRAICWILYDDKVSLELQDNHLIERFALAILLHSFNLEDELRMAIDTCDYDSVFCNENGLIVEIEWPHWKIEGTIPSELSHLRNLEVINFAFNHLKGTIPPQLGRLTNLKHLFLHSNELTGKLPDTLGLIGSLHSMSLQFNSLEGTIPSHIGMLKHLDILDFTSNKLAGPIPSEIFTCPNITYLSLRMNALTGTLHSSIGDLSSLKFLKLDSNILTGQLPSEIGQLTLLKRLSIFSNFFTGTLPQEFGFLTSAETLLLSNNKFTGTFPAMPFKDFNNLWAVEIVGNEFSGIIPDTIWDVNFEQHYATQKTFGLFLEDNDLRGTVPTRYCDKAGLNLRGVSVTSLYVDDSPWFLSEPKFECSCCSKGNCYIWCITKPSIHGTVRPECPASNIHKLESNVYFGGLDKIKNETYFAVAGSIGTVRHPFSVRNDLCLSPTGCYVVFKDKGVVSKDVDSYHLGYSAFTGSLIEGDSCDAVHICGTSINPLHPRREGLNHLTQLIAPDLSLLIDDTSTVRQAICWIMTEDNQFDKFNVCDGTLLQRYVMAHMFIFYDLMDETLASIPTCNWPGVTCDSTNKFVVRLDLSQLNLKGALFPEISHLIRLKEIRLHRNKLTGSIQPSTFLTLTELEIFDVGGNKFVGDIPMQLLKMPRIKVIDLSYNNFGGELPNEMGFTRTLEYLDIGKNLLKGHIPLNLIKCDKLKFLDLSRNYLRGTIPHMINNLKDIESINLSENRLSGSIPVGIFSPPNITNLALQTNLITGSIPTEIGLLQNVRLIRFDHNRIKGEIPIEAENLKTLEFFHLHQNQITGEAPMMPWLVNEDKTAYITDCATPMFNLPGRLNCATCQMCCNSLDQCLLNESSDVYIYSIAVSPFLLCLLVWLAVQLKHSKYLAFMAESSRPSEDIVDTNSVYLFVFASDKRAIGTFFFTVFIQIVLFAIYLHASNSTAENSDVVTPYRCPQNKIDCDDLRSADSTGWTIVCVVIFFYLGVDIVTSVLQIHKAFAQKNFRMLMSGLTIFSLTGLAFFTSLSYNSALARKNTDLIMNAVILLFINDLDEQCLEFLQILAPDWTKQMLEDVETVLQEKNDKDDSIDATRVSP